jgi:peptidoglycan hydrolase-like protein with peptidoglycan-binding domain
LPLERPLREPIIGPDGQMSRRWADYFDSLDTGQVTSSTVETDAYFVGQDSVLQGEIRRLKAKRDPVDVPAQDRRVGQIQAQLRNLKFLES